MTDQWFEVTVASNSFGVPPFIVDGRPTNTTTIEGGRRLARFLEQAHAIGVRVEWREVER